MSKNPSENRLANQGPLSLEEILRIAMKKEASDVHLKAGVVPVIRRWGKLRPLGKEFTILSKHEVDDLAFSVMDEKQKQTFREHKQIDLGYGISGLGRFRFNIFQQRGSTRIVIRNIPFVVPKFKDLDLPQVIEKIANAERGLILVTGITGSGKSTTLAAVIDHINRHRNKHIITIEDPIEYLIRDRKSIISQREIGTDALSFKDALRAALRQDPDVILIGEMRDRETMEIALTAAETGHLVLSSLHTGDANDSIHRILSAFPAEQQSQIRHQLASVLHSVISQRLVSRIDREGFVPAVEVLINNTRISEMIEDLTRTKEIHRAIEEGQTSWSMQSFDQSLHKLLGDKVISYQSALEASSNPEDFALRHSGVSSTDGKNWSQNHQEEKVEKSWHRIPELELDSNSGYQSNEEEDDSDDKTPFLHRVFKKN